MHPIRWHWGVSKAEGVFGRVHVSACEHLDIPNDTQNFLLLIGGGSHWPQTPDDEVSERLPVSVKEGEAQ